MGQTPDIHGPRTACTWLVDSCTVIDVVVWYFSLMLAASRVLEPARSVGHECQPEGRGGQKNAKRMHGIIIRPSQAEAECCNPLGLAATHWFLCTVDGGHIPWVCMGQSTPGLQLEKLKHSELGDVAFHCAQCASPERSATSRGIQGVSFFKFALSTNKRRIMHVHGPKVRCKLLAARIFRIRELSSHPQTQEMYGFRAVRPTSKDSTHAFRSFVAAWFPPSF